MGGIKISIVMPTNAVQLSHSGSRQYTVVAVVVVAVVVHGSSLDGSSSGVVVYTVFTVSFPLYLIIRFIYSSYPFFRPFFHPFFQFSRNRNTTRRKG